MAETIEMGTISSRGQIAIPADIRQKMNLREGGKVLFFLTDNTLLIKKVTAKSFAEITSPLKDLAQKAGMKETDVPALVHHSRAKR